MLGKLIELRNALQPKLKNNYDINLFDYKFWSEMETLVGKQREKAKDQLLLEANKEKTDGVVLRGGVYQLSLKTAEVNAFDKDAFITEAAAQFNVDKHKLRELSMKTNKKSYRKTYKVEEVDD